MIASLLVASLITLQEGPAGTWMGQHWSVNVAHTLLWEGEPYTPVGAAVLGTPEAVQAIASKGVKDLHLLLDWEQNWADAVAAAERNGCRYVVSLSSPMPTAPGWVCSAERLRIVNVSYRGRVEVPIEGASRVFYVVAGPGGSVTASGWATLADGRAAVDVNLNVAGEDYIVYFYPWKQQTDLPDYWDGLDALRDRLLLRAKDAKFGPGLRGLLNPFGKTAAYTPQEAGVVPDSVAFRLEFEQYLRQKYSTVDGLARAWQINVLSFRDFDEAARLIPLFSRYTGVDGFFDPASESVLSARREGSKYWDDLQTLVESSAVRRAKRLAEALKSVVNVPVLFEWAGWSSLHERRNIPGEGIGIPSVGSGVDAILGATGYAASSALAWGARGWLIAPEIRFADSGAPFPSETQLRSALTTLVDLGVKAWYIRATSDEEVAWIRQLNQEAATDATLVNRSARAIFYPINARFPADTMQLPGGVWWLPTPAAGDRIDLGTRFEAYRLAAPYDNHIAMWSVGGPRRTRLLVPNPGSLTIHSVSGAALDLKVEKDGVTLTLPSEPVLIFGAETTPVPEDSIAELTESEKALTAEAVRRGADITEERFLFADGLRKAKTSPGAALAQMQDAIRRMTLKVSPYVWREGERPTDTNYGFRIQSGGCSQGAALRMVTGLPLPAAGMRATYRIESRGSRDEHTIWVAAKVPKEVRPFVRVEFKGGASYPLGTLPMAEYGDGYGWYQVGKVSLPRGTYEVSLVVAPEAVAPDISVDVLLLTPQAFRPSGPRMPAFLDGTG
ncbi:MAG: hypothetical protein D6724_04830 [Armatimonadetes bacterium]|nr:MAG: hypothetical protein D6724_04830 [Armatimonadota bacterium]